jgi:hypothetical protein
MTHRTILATLACTLFFSCASSQAADAGPGEAPDVGLRDAAVDDLGVGHVDAGEEAGVADAGQPDSGVRDRGDATTDSGVLLTYVDDIQSILASKCGSCHSEDAPFGSSFATSFAVLNNTTAGYNSGCSRDGGGQLLLGECVVETVRNQRDWSGMDCNSWHPGQYHRDYSWTCVTASEAALIEAWGASGMLER